MRKEIKVGDRLQITSNDLFGVGKAIKIEEVNTDNQKGILVTFELDDLNYTTNPYFFGDDGVLNSQILERKGRSGMPVEYSNCVAKDFDWSFYAEDVTPQKKIVNDFVIDFNKYLMSGRGLYIYSAVTGSGKTKLACIVVNEILKRRDISVRFISVAEFIELVKQKDDGSKEEMEAIFNAGLLVLDDIGAQVETKDWISAALFRLIYSRWTGHLPTIYTSNVETTNLKIDPRVSERIYELSTPLPMPEINVRRKIADKHTEQFLSGLLNGNANENVWDTP